MTQQVSDCIYDIWIIWQYLISYFQSWKITNTITIQIQSIYFNKCGVIIVRKKIKTHAYLDIFAILQLRNVL